MRAVFFLASKKSRRTVSDSRPASERMRNRNADSPVRAAGRKTLEHVSLRPPGAVDLLRPEGGDLPLRRAARRSTLARVGAQHGAGALGERVAGSRSGLVRAFGLEVGRAAGLSVVVG